MRTHIRHKVLVAAKLGLRVNLDDHTFLTKGGEACLYRIPGSDFVAKIYHDEAGRKEAKLRSMITQMPSSELKNVIAWPKDLLHVPNRPDLVCGYLMQYLPNRQRISEVINPGARRVINPSFTYRYLITTARNLASIVQSIHDAGFVIGDINDMNFLVGSDASIACVDTDSFQVRLGECYFPCLVGKPEYTPREMQGVDFGTHYRFPEQDRFGLGVLLFQLMMDGRHPFSGLVNVRNRDYTLQQRIEMGFFPYESLELHMTRSVNTKVPISPHPNWLSFDVLPPAIRKLFWNCFVVGHNRPGLRPTAGQWRQALDSYRTSLIHCSRSNQHEYSAHLQDCPWCTRRSSPKQPPPIKQRESHYRRALTESGNVSIQANCPIVVQRKVYSLGERVFHPVFGIGTVISTLPGKVQVRFRDYDTKMLNIVAANDVGFGLLK